MLITRMFSLTPAGAAHDEVDLHSGARSLVQRLADLRVLERVHLRDDAPLGAAAGQLDLGLDQLQEPPAHVDRSDQDLAVALVPRAAGQEVEQVHEVGTDVLAAGEEPQIRVEPGGVRVIVAGADVAVGADPLGFLADDQDGLRVRLEADDAVGDVRADLFQRAGPLDVLGLVEACLQLDEHRDLLAVLDRAHQGLHDGRVRRGAVQRLLDGQHLRIDRGSLHEALHAGGERMVRMVHQQVALADHVEDTAREHVVAQRPQPRVRQRAPGLVA
jgi:hypothetical protein